MPSVRTPYGRALLIVFAPLTAIALVAAGLNLWGPLRLTGHVANPTSLVAYSGQSVVFDTNRELAEVAADDVTVDPETPVAVRTVADKVAVDVLERLRYDTEYTVSVAADPRSDAPGSLLSTTFRTPRAQAHLLRTTDGGEDEIVRVTLGAEDPEPMYSADGILEYDVARGTLAVALSTGTAAGVIEVVDLEDGSARQLTFPAPGTVSDIALSSDGATIGYLFTSAASEDRRRVRALVVQRLTDDAEPAFVENVEGDVVSVDTWAFVPQRVDVVALLMAGDVIAANPVGGGEAVPLGRAAVLHGTADDVRRTTITSDRGGLSYLDLTDGSLRAAPTSPDGIGERTHLVSLETVPDSDVVVELRSVFADDAVVPVQVVREIDADGRAREIFGSVQAGTSLLAMSLSPNGQYVAVEVAPAATIVIDRRTGETAATWPGTGAVW